MVDDDFISTIWPKRGLHGLCNRPAGIDLALLAVPVVFEHETHVADDCSIFSIVTVITGLE